MFELKLEISLYNRICNCNNYAPFFVKMPQIPVTNVPTSTEINKEANAAATALNGNLFLSLTLKYVNFLKQFWKNFAVIYLLKTCFYIISNLLQLTLFFSVNGHIQENCVVNHQQERTRWNTWPFPLRFNHPSKKASQERSCKRGGRGKEKWTTQCPPYVI